MGKSLGQVIPLLDGKARAWCRSLSLVARRLMQSEEKQDGWPEGTSEL